MIFTYDYAIKDAKKAPLLYILFETDGRKLQCFPNELKLDDTEVFLIGFTTLFCCASSSKTYFLIFSFLTESLQTLQISIWLQLMLKIAVIRKHQTPF